MQRPEVSKQLKLWEDEVLVVDDKGDYRGMISVQDLLAVIASDEKARADMLEDFIFPKL
ncbi:MAG: hypothetical protein ACM3NO_01300 [Deltaproteobacteria bacterium]